MFKELIILTCSIGVSIGCLEEWSNQCKSNVDCCSQLFCDKPAAWEKGVCKKGTGGGEGTITFEQFSNAATSNGYGAPSQDQYNTCIRIAPTAGTITSKQELAMFLAQILWESGGLIYKKEIRCAQTGCPGEYRTGEEQANKFYYGRGYIQLTWIYNYKQCSQDLYQDNRLVDNPDLVSDSEEGAWGSAFWFWKQNVHSKPGVQEGQFGATTKAINGGLECGSGPNTDKARKRFGLYVNVLKAFNLNDVQPNEGGCY